MSGGGGDEDDDDAVSLFWTKQSECRWIDERTIEQANEFPPSYEASSLEPGSLFARPFAGRLLGSLVQRHPLLPRIRRAGRRKRLRLQDSNNGGISHASKCGDSPDDE